MKTWVKYGAAIMGLLIVSALIISFGMKKEESYRDIKVMSIKGTATVERASVGSLDAYEDMKLESGDRLSVDSSSSLILSMDDNKYAMLEPGSSLTLEADGTRENSRTIIHLESGAVMNYLSEKLSEKSSYEVTVPNSTMAVRGTVFRVAIVYDEDGDSYTTVQVFDGIVGCRLVFPDGTISEEEVQLAPGKEVLIHGDTEISEYVGDKGHDIDYTTLNREALEFLLFCIDDGSDLCLTREEVEELLRRLDQTEEPEESAEVKKPAKTEKEPAVIETPEPVVPAVEETPSSSGGSSETSEDSPGNDDNQKSHHSSKKKPSSSDEETKTYTVTFQTASGDVFCTQTVEDGKTASKPKLQPSASGSWNYDFTKAVTENIIIKWSAQ
ncbi:FecR family protein [Hominiventricola filiformis]|uniref:FecR domain-containing protein n=1 Tax=Hominiventricola filiformis TaxID=2885352 RepID=A0AAE3A790_9FIRM|nr:FecR domain-containing protein [Hominiventricola filiformis]MCC2127276.1 FecR domain-containing protein [Hominiventricola filiformis]